MLKIPMNRLPWVKPVAIVVAVLLLLGLIEGWARLWLHDASTHLADTDIAAEDRYMAPPMQALRKKYNNRLDHLRGISALSGAASPPTELLFSTIRPFAAGTDNLLLQGGAWAEQLGGEFPVKMLKAYSEYHGMGVVAAGVEGFSPAPMTVQLRILREDFGLNPTTLVAIIDQSAIGDEKYRYPNPQPDAGGRLFAIHAANHVSPYQDADYPILQNRNLREAGWAISRFIRHRSLKSQFEKNAAPPVAASDILAPLVQGPSESEAALFVARLDRYIEEYFSDPAARTLLLVTHPYRNHLAPAGDAQRYKGDVAALVARAAAASRWRARITHLDFGAQFSAVYGALTPEQIYRDNDAMTRLADGPYATRYLKKILESVVIPRQLAPIYVLPGP